MVDCQEQAALLQDDSEDLDDEERSDGPFSTADAREVLANWKGTSMVPLADLD